MQTVIITIGRNVNGQPMDERDWEAFTRCVKDTLFAIVPRDSGTLHTVAHGTGHWEGETEETYTVVCSIASEYVDPVRESIALAGQSYRQEAIYFGLVAPDGVVPC
jgi:hypothetical protein